MKLDIMYIVAQTAGIITGQLILACLWFYHINFLRRLVSLPGNILDTVFFWEMDLLMGCKCEVEKLNG